MDAFDLYSPAIDADPFPYYEILREQYPCYWSESGQLWILSRYDDIVQAARDWETFSSSQGNMIDELPARNDRSAAPRPPAGVEPGRFRPQEHRAHHCPDD
jgi:cytochrome P450